MPHVPLHVTDAFKNKSELGLYGDVIMELDWSVGQIRKALTEEGILNNTLFIFTSDNGPQIGSSGALRGRKAQTWEGGQRVPAIISWPDSITGGSVSNEVVSTLDLFPTILANTKGSIEQHNNYNFDGRDISAHLFDPGLGLPDSPFFYYNRNGQPEAVRLGKWKLHIAKELGWNKEMYGTFKTALYNLDTDIGEQINLAEKHPEIVIKLSEIIRNFDQSLNQD
jgi:arylsulfatase A-like enzyme